MRHFPSSTLPLSLSFLSFFCGLASYPSLWFNQVSGAAFSSPGCSPTVQKKRHHYTPSSQIAPPPPHSESTSFPCLNAVVQHRLFPAQCALQNCNTERVLAIPLAVTFIKSFLESWQSVTYSTELFHSTLHLSAESSLKQKLYKQRG